MAAGTHQVAGHRLSIERIINGDDEGMRGGKTAPN